MTELVVVSGKGGTGKTTVVASLAALACNAVIADCDVDAADLHLLLQPQATDRTPYEGSEKARVDTNLCTRCGACVFTCRFDAIISGGESLRIDPLACEGCGACAFVCPAGRSRCDDKSRDGSTSRGLTMGRWFTASCGRGRRRRGSS